MTCPAAARNKTSERKWVKTTFPHSPLTGNCASVHRCNNKAAQRGEVR